MRSCEFLIIGGGPAGLSCATTLGKAGHQVIIVEREKQAGGIPRHCGHYPFGLREARRLFKGPQYAAWLVKEAQDAGVEIFTQTTAISRDAMKVQISNTEGLNLIEAKHIVIATGTREASRAQRNVAGVKTGGVISTGALQALVYLAGAKPFSRPVILGSELVSYSAINTCRHLGIKPAAMVDASPSPKARKIFTPYPRLLSIPTYNNIKNLEIFGSDKVKYIRFESDKGKQIQIDCDGVIMSGQFRPEASLAKSFDLSIDDWTKGPKVDQFARTSDPNIYAIGNGLRPVETSGWCWQEGKSLGEYLLRTQNPPKKRVSISVKSPQIKYVMPSQISIEGERPVFDKLQIRLNKAFKGRLSLKLGNATLASQKINSRPERRITLPLTSQMIALCQKSDDELGLYLEN